MQSQKQLIYDIVKESHSHLNAEEISVLARERKSSIAVGTVYRNLAALCAEGSLRSVSVPSAPLYYDATLSPHDHLVCRCCGRLRDIVLPLDLLPLLKLSAGEEVSGYSLCISYLCPECKEASAQK